MYKQTLNLSPEETIQLNWEDDYANFSVCLNDQPLGSFHDKADLKLGRRFYLPKGREIRVVLASNGLEVWYNDTELLSGTSLTGGRKTTEIDYFRNAARNLLWIGGLLTLINLIELLEARSTGEEIKIFGGAGLAVTSSLFGLGVWAKSTASKSPLWIAIGLLLLDMVICLMEGNFYSGLINFVIIYYLYRGIQAGPKPPSTIRDFRANSPLDEGI